MATHMVWMITFFIAAYFSYTQANCVQKTAKGECCVFPYKYQGKDVSKCLPRKVGGYWCATTYNYDKEKKWGDCALKKANCEQKTTKGECCVFPYKYQGKDVSKCLPRKVGGHWCATTYNYDKEKKWGDCALKKANCEQKTTKGECCVFPYKYKGKDVSKCLPRKVGGYRWCATTYNYDKEKKWGDCALKKDICPRTTIDGKSCVFPFKYAGKEYTQCIQMLGAVSWCATTSNVDRDGEFGYCIPATGRCSDIRISH